MSSVPLPDNRLVADLPALVQGLAGSAWHPIAAAWLASPAGQGLAGFLAERQAAGATIYPCDPFRALRLTPRESVRVVILGQDPYHGPGQAEGLAFSVPDGLRWPPSLRNIHRERVRDLGGLLPESGSLAGWAQAGVLLLNTVLTVEDGRPASHARQGWEALTGALLAATVADPAPKAFLLWGAHAQALGQGIGAPHRVWTANHPSPLSATRGPQPFIGCGHFSAVRDFLACQGLPPVF